MARGGYGEWGFEIEPQRVRGVTDRRFAEIMEPYRLPLHQEIAIYRGMRGRKTGWYVDIFHQAMREAIENRWPPNKLWIRYDALVEQREAHY